MEMERFVNNDRRILTSSRQIGSGNIDRVSNFFDASDVMAYSGCRGVKAVK